MLLYTYVPEHLQHACCDFVRHNWFAGPTRYTKTENLTL